jgi:hypothetical protein
MITLKELDNQPASNLRQSFSVVGLLKETDSFYERVIAQIHCVDMSLNPNVTGAKLESRKDPEMYRCFGVYSGASFQEH